MTSFAETPRVPVIDFEPFEAGGPWRDHVATQIDWAASEFGAFYIVGHGIDCAAFERLALLARTSFGRSSMSVQRVHSNPELGAWPAYFPNSGARAVATPQRRQVLRFGDDIWGGESDGCAELPGLNESALECMDELTSLSHRLVTGFARALRLGDHYFHDHYTKDPARSLRICSDTPNFGDTRGASETVETGFLTLVYQDEAGGQQVNRHGVWLDVPPVAGSFIVMVGQKLSQLAASHYQSVARRVVNTSGRVSISTAFGFDSREPVTTQDPVTVQVEVPARARKAIFRVGAL